MLEINQELLYEAVHLKHSMDEAKKERMSSTDAEKQKEKMEEEEACSHDWTKYVVLALLEYITKQLTIKTAYVGDYRQTLHIWPHLQTGKRPLKQRPLTSHHHP